MRCETRQLFWSWASLLKSTHARQLWWDTMPSLTNQSACISIITAAIILKLCNLTHLQHLACSVTLCVWVKTSVLLKQIPVIILKLKKQLYCHQTSLWQSHQWVDQPWFQERKLDQVYPKQQLYLQNPNFQSVFSTHCRPIFELLKRKVKLI